jgi:di/tricarboxylate transporter
MEAGPLVLLASVMVGTTLLTSFISNIGAISIMFPIIFSICNMQQLDGTPFFLGLAFSASAAFISPVGYQTNLIIYGPGNYNFRDFIRIGFPVTLVYLTSVIAGIWYLYLL